MVIDGESLYPDIKPYNEGELRVSGLHTLHFEECGNPHGKPAIFLHGGPGSGKAEIWRRLFNPQHYRIVLFDQRGCGQSRPYGSLEDNTTDQLVGDIEKLREHLQIARWLVMGGSWGTTLGLVYSQRYPERVSELILYGLFLGTKREIDWYYRAGGASMILPEAWEQFSQMIPVDERQDLLVAHHKRLNGAATEAQTAAAKAWSLWEAAGLRLIPDATLMQHFTQEHVAIAQARIESHYFINNCFLQDNELILLMHRISAIPTVLVHGRYDLICPVETACIVHKHLPESKLKIIPAAGHSAREPGIQQALIDTTNEFALGDPLRC